MSGKRVTIFVGKSTTDDKFIFVRHQQGQINEEHTKQFDHIREQS